MFLLPNYVLQLHNLRGSFFLLDLQLVKLLLQFAMHFLHELVRHPPFFLQTASLLLRRYLTSLQLKNQFLYFYSQPFVFCLLLT